MTKASGIEQASRVSLRCAFGLLVAVPVGNVAMQLYAVDQRSGVTTCWSPREENKQTPDSEVVTGEWNLHNEVPRYADMVAEIYRKNHLDAMVLTETDGLGALILRAKLPEAYVCFAVADGKLSSSSGGFGNTLITAFRPGWVRTKKLNGDSLPAVAMSLTKNIPDILGGLLEGDTPSSNKIAADIEENRVAVAAELPYRTTDGKMGSYVFVGAHDSADEAYGSRQHRESIRFIQGLSDGGHQPVLVCMDANPQNTNKLINQYRDARVYLSETRATSPSGKALDLCGQTSRYEQLEKGKSIVLVNYLSDHHPVIFATRAVSVYKSLRR